MLKKTNLSIIILLVCTLFKTPLPAASINIYNDSPFTLYGEILTADGSSKGNLLLAPLNLTMWHEELGNATWSQTPFTIIFTCKNGTQYGVLANVQTGATVSALASDGKRYCKKDKTKDKSTTPDQKTTKPSGTLELDPIWGPP